MVEKSTAVQPAKEQSLSKPTTFESLFDRANEVFGAISRRAYEIFEGKGYMAGGALGDWFQAERELFHPAHINVTESDDALDIKAEVPGFNEKELEIRVEPRRLMISGKRETSKEEKKGKTIYSETCANQVMRLIDLPAEVETGKVTAALKNGVLEVKLPKAAKPRTVRVEPKVA